MRTIWMSLAWKEWHEHKWKLAAMTVILLSVAATPLFAIDLWRDMLPMSTGLVTLCMLPLTLFIAAAEASSEGSRGTLAFTQSLPVPMWKLAIQKLVAGLLTSLAPVAIALASICGIAAVYGQLGIFDRLRFANFFGGGENLNPAAWLGTTSLVASTAVGSVYLWSVAVGVNRKDEVSAGALALAVMAVWWTLVVAFPRLVGANSFRELGPLHHLLFAASPGGLTFVVAESARREVDWWAVIPVAVVVHGALAAWYVMRFGSLASGSRSQTQARAESATASWLAEPRRSALAAIAWKQSRESGPVVLAGLAGIFGISTLIAGISSEIPIRDIPVIVTGTTAYVGVLVTLVVGIGLFLNDLSPQLNTFWRSRPIDPNLWFWTKAVTGISVVAASLTLPLALSALLWFKNLDFRTSALFTVLATLWIYSAAIMTTSLVRQAIYAAILCFGAMYTSVMIILGISRGVQILFGQTTRSWLADPTIPELAVGMILSTIVFTLVAWLAVKNDWGRKSRY